MRIEKKIWPDFFDKVKSGEKKFEIRLADFECSNGDILVLREWDPAAKQYTGRVIEREVSQVIRTHDLKFWPEEQLNKYGLLIISLK